MSVAWLDYLSETPAKDPGNWCHGTQLIKELYCVVLYCIVLDCWIVFGEILDWMGWDVWYSFRTELCYNCLLLNSGTMNLYCFSRCSLFDVPPFFSHLLPPVIRPNLHLPSHLSKAIHLSPAKQSSSCICVCVMCDLLNIFLYEELTKT